MNRYLKLILAVEISKIKLIAKCKILVTPLLATVLHWAFKMSYFVVNSVPADGLSMGGARTSAGTVMT